MVTMMEYLAWPFNVNSINIKHHKTTGKTTIKIRLLKVFGFF